MKLTICGHDFYTEKLPKFDQSIHAAWAAIQDKYNLSSIEAERAQIADSMRSLRPAVIQAADARVQAAKRQLDKEMEKEEPDWERVDKLTHRYADQLERLQGLEASESERVSSRTAEQVAKMRALQERNDKAVLELAHALAKDGRSVDEWLLEATDNDYSQAAELLGKLPRLPLARLQTRSGG
jgi:chromosome segregation ATPase